MLRDLFSLVRITHCYSYIPNFLFSLYYIFSNMVSTCSLVIEHLLLMVLFVMYFLMLTIMVFVILLYIYFFIIIFFLPLLFYLYVNLLAVLIFFVH